MTPPAPTRETPAGRAYNDLRNLAKRNGRDSSEYLTLYALEGFLVRLARSEYAPDFVLKGGVLMAAFAARRPTRDIDFAVSGFSNDVDGVVTRVRQICAVAVDDGLEFDGSSVAGDEIRDDADYSGVRVKIVTRLAKATVPMHLDINFGDPIWPAPTPTDLPPLLGGTLSLPGYPDHMVLAEKIVTAIERSIVNTRWRDFVDIESIIRARSISGADLMSAIGVVANHRSATITTLSEALSGMGEVAQSRWSVWRRKQRLEDATPEMFQNLLDSCIAFADPVLAGQVWDGSWDPSPRSWTARSL